MITEGKVWVTDRFDSVCDLAVYINSIPSGMPITGMAVECSFYRLVV